MTMVDPQTVAPKAKNNTPRWRKMAESLLSLAIALLVVFAIRSSIIEPFKIPSGSMIPTLLVGDRIFTNKFAYGFRVPFTDSIGAHPLWILRRDPPKRGDIIVFKYPPDDSVYFIKRVVGVPGDRVEMRDRVLYINNAPAVQTAAPAADANRVLDSFVDEERYDRKTLTLVREKLGDKEHWALYDSSSMMFETFGPITVPPDRLFVMGDNRDYSKDSRFWGFVPFDNVAGKAFMTWLSFRVDFAESRFVFRPLRSGSLLR